MYQRVGCGERMRGGEINCPSPPWGSGPRTAAWSPPWGRPPGSWWSTSAARCRRSRRGSQSSRAGWGTDRGSASASPPGSWARSTCRCRWFRPGRAPRPAAGSGAGGAWTSSASTGGSLPSPGYWKEKPGQTQGETEPREDKTKQHTWKTGILGIRVKQLFLRFSQKNYKF